MYQKSVEVKKNKITETLDIETAIKQAQQNLNKLNGLHQIIKLVLENEVDK